jgi:hypothetical protein
MKRVAIIGISVTALQACATGWGPGYHLPQGDADRGRTAFLALHCDACHSIAGEPSTDPGSDSRVTLGGQTVRVKTYGDLVTSIVNPSHRLARGYSAAEVSGNGESLMAAARLNDVMTVQQLVDVVAFLQDEYELVPPPFWPNWEEYPSGDHDLSSARPPLHLNPSTFE